MRTEYNGEYPLIIISGYEDNRVSDRIYYLYSFIALIGNSTIIYVKLRNFRKRKNFDLLVINLAFALLLYSIRASFKLLDVIKKRSDASKFCYAQYLIAIFALIQTAYSLSALTFLLTVAPNLKQRNELLSIGLIWIFGMLLSYPRFNFETYTFKLQNEDLYYNGCIFDYNKDIPKIIRNILEKIQMHSATSMPVIVVIICCAAMFHKKFTAQQKILLKYSTIVSVYFCIGASILIGLRIAENYLNTDTSSLSNMNSLFFQHFLNLICLFNPIVYFYFYRASSKNINAQAEEIEMIVVGAANN